MMAFVKGTEPAVACGARRQGVPGAPEPAAPTGPPAKTAPQAAAPDGDPLAIPREVVDSR
jgi:hypothetical protein